MPAGEEGRAQAKSTHPLSLPPPVVVVVVALALAVAVAVAVAVEEGRGERPLRNSPEPKGLAVFAQPLSEEEEAAEEKSLQSFLKTLGDVHLLVTAPPSTSGVLTYAHRCMILILPMHPWP